MGRKGSNSKNMVFIDSGDYLTLVRRNVEPDEMTSRMIKKMKTGEKTVFIRPVKAVLLDKSKVDTIVEDFPDEVPECVLDLAYEFSKPDTILPLLCVEYNKEWVQKYCRYCKLWMGI